MEEIFVNEKKKIPRLIILAIVLLVVINSAFFTIFYSDLGLNLNNFYSFIGSSDSNEISVYVDKLPYGVDAGYRYSITEAESYWNQRSGVLFNEAPSKEDFDLSIKWVKEFGGDHIGCPAGAYFADMRQFPVGSFGPLYAFLC